ncbi:unnamed protein product [Lactuca virosa]|uniref:Uncharacterized protein n=1 Tax=Lactuca virosa TaxID=75947 RepID=A0AAU9MSU1_9ASTR|nr:unnamed protein product [Lactuca virosa]
MVAHTEIEESPIPELTKEQYQMFVKHFSSSKVADETIRSANIAEAQHQELDWCGSQLEVGEPTKILNDSCEHIHTDEPELNLNQEREVDIDSATQDQHASDYGSPNAADPSMSTSPISSSPAVVTNQNLSKGLEQHESTTRNMSPVIENLQNEIETPARFTRTRVQPKKFKDFLVNLPP